MKKCLGIVLGIGIFTSSFAGGFQVALQGQKQTGMAHIGTPFKLDAASIYFNPGALPMLDKKVALSFGVSPIFSTVAFQNEEYNYNSTSDNPIGSPFSVYFNYIIKEKLSIGIGVYTPFGSSAKWDDDWEGRYLIQNIALKAIFIQPTIGYKITDNIGIGAGLIYATGSVEINKALPLPVGDATSTVNLQSKAKGFGGNIGIYADVAEKFHLGLTYKTAIKMKAEDGDVQMKGVPKALASSFPAENKFSTTLNLPGSINFGVGYDVTEKLKLAVEVNYVMWSVYDSLIFDFKTNTSSLEDSHNPRLYENTLAFRIGAEYELNDMFTPRLGFYYDPSPIQDDYFSPETPNMDNLGFTAGLSYMPTERLSIDVSFLYIHGLKRTGVTYAPSNFGGDYKTSAVIPGIGLAYKF
jgi:long-chain fatty acid transport protein